MFICRNYGLIHFHFFYIAPSGPQRVQRTHFKDLRTTFLLRCSRNCKSFVILCVCVCVCVWCVCSVLTLCDPMEFSMQEYWSKLPFPTPGHHSDLGIEPTSLVSPALAGRFFTTVPPGKPCIQYICIDHSYTDSYSCTYTLLDVLIPFAK